MGKIFKINIFVFIYILIVFTTISHAAVANKQYKKMQYKDRNFKALNEINLHYHNYISSTIYSSAMQAYEEPNSNFVPIIDIDNQPIDPRIALQRIKNEICWSPQICLILTSGYLRDSFIEDNTTCKKNIIISLVALFIQHEHYYQMTKNKILSDATKEKQLDFLYNWITYEYVVRDLHKKDEYFSTTMTKQKKHYCQIYTHKNNFLNTNIFLWLIKEKYWIIPTNEQIKNGNINVRGWGTIPYKDKKIIKYKITLLHKLTKNKNFYSKLIYFHILNGQRMSNDSYTEATVKMRNEFFGDKTLQSIVLSILSTTYWLFISTDKMVDTTGDLILDIFCSPLLLMLTPMGIFITVWTVNFIFGIYVLYMNGILFWFIHKWKSNSKITKLENQTHKIQKEYCAKLNAQFFKKHRHKLREKLRHLIDDIDLIL